MSLEWEKNALGPFAFRNGKLFCEDVSLEEIALNVGSPVYIYSLTGIINNYDAIQRALDQLNILTCYSVKANSHIALLRALIRQGAGLNIASRGDLYRGIQAGVDSRKVVFSGPGKKYDEIRYALRNNILMFNVESLQELEMIQLVCQDTKSNARISLRINPEIDAKIHKQLADRKKYNKFGFTLNQVPQALEMIQDIPQIELIGVHCHIGTQILTIDPYIKALDKMLALVDELREQQFDIEYINLGGGMGIAYEIFDLPFSFEEWAQSIKLRLKKSELKVIIEPGRFLIGNNGCLLINATYTKQSNGKQYIVADAGMNDLMRPALHNGYHQIWPIMPREGIAQIYDVSGPLCESEDFLGKHRELSPIEQGDFLAVMSAGAYGFSMANNYHSRPFPAEVLIAKDRFFIIRAHQEIESLVSGEQMPPIL